MPGYDVRRRFAKKAIRRESLSKTSFVTRKAEAVYSWRSKPSDSDLTSEDGVSFGIPLPLQSGSVTAILSSRRDYYNAVGQMLAGANAPAKEPAQCLVNSKGDSGHYFRKATYAMRRNAYAVIRDTRYPDHPVGLSGPVFNLATVQKLPWMSGIGNFPISNVSGFPAQSSVQDRLNRAFRNMDPTRERSQIGESVVSLLRGDFPRLVKNYKRFFDAAATSKKRLNAVGSEYLNSSFGWQPLVQDLIDFITALVKLDSLVYGSGYRRSRMLEFDPVMWSNTYAAWANGYSQGSATVSFLNNFKPNTDYVARFSTSLNARLVPIARPSMVSNSHLEKAYDTIRELGLWYPALGWDVIPWSWLLDWIVDIGTGLSNALVYGKTKGLVNIDYAWATHKLEVLAETTFENRVFAGSTINGDVRGITTTLSTYLERVPASPFGFGLTLDGLSSAQKSVLVALGLARMR